MPLTKEDVTEELCIAPPQMSLLNDIPSPKTTPTTLSTKGPKSPTESYFDGVSNPLSKKASAHLSPLPSPGGGGRGGSHGGGDSDNTLCFVVLPDEDPSSPVTRVPSKHNCRAVELPRSSVNIIRELNNLTLDGSNQVDEDKRSAFLLSPADVIDDESSYCSYVNKVHSSNAMSTVEGGVQKSGVQMRAAMGVARLLDCIAWKVLVMIATFHLLFDHDLYLLVLPKQADHVTLVATSFVAGILLAELFLNLLVIGPQYFTQLFFYLDLIAWVTVLPDVFALWGYDVLSSDSNAPNLAIARVSRVVRIAVRLGRIGQLAKHINKLQSIMTCGRKQEMQDDFEDCLGSIEKSQVGREIEEKLTKKNVFFTLVLILGTFMLSDPPANDVSAEEIFLRMYIANPTTESLQVIYLELGDKLLSLECNNTVDYYSDAKEDHRTADIREIEASFMGSSATVSISKLSENKQSYIFSVWKKKTSFDQKKGGNTRESLEPSLESCNGIIVTFGFLVYNLLLFVGYFCAFIWIAGIVQWVMTEVPASITAICLIWRQFPGGFFIPFIWILLLFFFAFKTIKQVCLTVFVIVCLLGFNYAVAYDVQRILVSPIERLSHLVKMFMTNPLAKFNWKEEQVTGETGELIKSMKKLGNLIQVGFGEAGAEIVSQNLRYGSLFTVFPGKNMQAIFSFCDIRDFTSATEILRHDVMFFVNYVAEIVHKTVQECGGRPNKNIGDAFLCIWRLGDMEAHPSPDTLERYRVSVCHLPQKAMRRRNTSHPTPHYYIFKDHQKRVQR